MRFVEIRIDRFGSFCDCLLQMQDPSQGFQLIYGSNEAGKSTALRAIRGFLYGIPERSRDGFLHGGKGLRVGAVLSNGAGGSLTLYRRKGRVSTLLNEAGEPVAENVLRELLAGVDESLFQSLYGLDYEQLVEGGADILAGKGDLGQALFAAGSGVRSLHAIVADLAKDIQAIYAPRGRNPRLNSALGELQAGEQRLRDLALSPADYQRQCVEIADARSRVAQAESSCREGEARLEALKRIQRTRPPLVERRRILDRLAELACVPLLDVRAAERRVAAQEELRHLALARAQREGELREVAEALQAELPEGLLAQESGIAELARRRGQYTKERLDLPGLLTERGVISRACSDIMAELGREDQLLGLAPALPAAVKASLRELSQTWSGLRARLQDAESLLAEATLDVQAVEKELSELPPAVEVSRLQQLLGRARRHGDLGGRIKELEASLRMRRRKVRDGAEALGLALDDPAALLRLPLPLRQTLRTHEQSQQALEREEERLAQSRGALREELDSRRAALAELQGGGPLPSARDLQRARSQREAVWKSIRERLAGGSALVQPADAPSPDAPPAGAQPPEAAPAIAEPRPAAELMGEFESLVAQADAIADRMCRQAERVAAAGALESRIAEVEGQLAALAETAESLAARRVAAEEQWRAEWSVCGIAPRSPAEMREWLDACEELRRLAGETVAGEDELRSLLDSAQALRAGLVEEMAALAAGLTADLGLPAPSAEDELGCAVERADAVVQSAAAAELTREQTAKRLADRRLLAQRRASARDAVQRELDSWNASWREAASQAALPRGTTVEGAVAYLDKLNELNEKLGSLRRLEARVSDIKANMSDFEESVAGVAGACGLEAGGGPADRVVDLLQSALQDALKVREARRAKLERHDQLSDELRDMDGRQAAARQVLAALVSEARCADESALPEVEALCAEKRELSNRLDQLERVLLEEGIALEELEIQAMAVPPEELPGVLREMEEHRKEAGEELERSRRALWECERRLEQMDGRADAAQEAEAIQSVAARVRSELDHLARLQLAQSVLNLVIDQYRRESQDPVLREAEAMLQSITLGSIVGLAVDFDEKDNPILLCQRDDGTAVTVGDLSSGTRDQLYLALRLASISRQLDRSQPIPLVFDDILVNFDDERAARTLSVLGRLAERTQILFFTHHAHLVEIARRTLPPNLLRLHRLGACRSSAAPA